ncbi:MAG: SH3 domain-containing protein, partial [Clostridia bacterium]|nr:SH3 domain-containing protein [Clostridia bacterium]
MNQRNHRAFLRILSCLLCFMLLFTQFSVLAFAEEGKNAIVNGNRVNVRHGPGTNHNTMLQLDQGHAVVVLSEHPDDNGEQIPWYEISFTYKNEAKKGYMRSDFVTIKSENDVPIVENKDFEAQLAAFPGYYHEALRALHELHPSWNFEAVDTGIDWNYVQEKENQLGWSLVNDGIISHYSTAPGSYDWETDTFFVLEGSNWYQAHPQVIAYYMDPRNFLNESDIFQFEKLAFSSVTQTEEVIAAMLSDTFMAGQTILNENGEEIS